MNPLTPEIQTHESDLYCTHNCIAHTRISTHHGSHETAQARLPEGGMAAGVGEVGADVGGVGEVGADVAGVGEVGSSGVLRSLMSEIQPASCLCMSCSALFSVARCGKGWPASILQP